MYVIGVTVNSLAEFGENSILMGVKKDKLMLVAENYRVIHKIEVAGNISFTSSQLMPNFDWETFPFIVALGKKTLDIVNVKTGYRDVLIRGTADNDYRQRAMQITLLEG